MDPKVGVVILTYNRLDLLKTTICKVLAQTLEPDEVLVVNNGSTDGTGEYLNTRKDLSVIHVDENSGPAGGFYEGIKYFAVNTAVDFVWLMDDDFFPSNSCLQILVENTNDGILVFPYVREKDFASRHQCGWWGVLIPMPVIKKVGYPRKDLFFWAEDTEYLQVRIHQKNNYPMKWIPAAKGVHFTKRETNYRQPWRYYYEIRNSTYTRIYLKEWTRRRAYKLFRSWVKLCGNVILNENKKGEKMKLLLLGSFHGVTKQLGKTIDPKTGKRLNRNKKPVIYFKHRKND